MKLLKTEDIYYEFIIYHIWVFDFYLQDVLMCL